nr:hypothetical protein [uncultured Rhodopila sp.]
MAVIASDGFDHYNLGTDPLLRVGALQWSLGTYPSSGINIVTPGRGGFGKALQVYYPGNFVGAVTNGIYGIFSSNLSEYYFAFALNDGTNLEQVFVELIDPLAGNNAQVTVSIDPTSGTVTLLKGAFNSTTVLAASEPAAINTATYPIVEIGVRLGSSGFLTVRVNNNQVVTYSGNTQSTANASFGGVLFGLTYDAGNGRPGSFEIDDFRYNDTTTGPGSYPCNAWMGDLRVATIFPIGNGAVAWTPLANANWQEVSETAFDGDTTYNFASTLGAEDLFNLAPLAGTISYVIAVQVVGAYRQTDASPHTVAQHVKVGGTDTALTTRNTTLGYEFFSDMMAINPTTAGSWTVAEVNAMQIGYEAVT